MGGKPQGKDECKDVEVKEECKEEVEEECKDEEIEEGEEANYLVVKAKRVRKKCADAPLIVNTAESEPVAKVKKEPANDDGVEGGHGRNKTDGTVAVKTEVKDEEVDAQGKPEGKDECKDVEVKEECKEEVEEECKDEEIEEGEEANYLLVKAKRVRKKCADAAQID